MGRTRNILYHNTSEYDGRGISGNREDAWNGTTTRTLLSGHPTSNADLRTYG